MIVAIASGKGGTGKTTVSVNLAKAWGSQIQLVDCDVEEPNDHLFLKRSGISSETVDTLVPQIDDSLCNKCGLCSRFCQYSALACLGGKIVVISEMCHSCGGCAKICPTKAISEVNKPIGVIESAQSRNISLIQGRLNVGVPMAPPLIRAVKSRIAPEIPAILDAPPGTSCPVVASISGVNFLLLVTEPTPFGLHDLKLAVEMARKLKLSFGVVINRVGIGDGRVHEFCRQEGISVLLEIPDDRRIAEVYSKGEIVIERLPEYRALFLSLIEKIDEQIKDGSKQESCCSKNGRTCNY